MGLSIAVRATRSYGWRRSIVFDSSGTREAPGYIADLTEDLHV